MKKIFFFAILILVVGAVAGLYLFINKLTSTEPEARTQRQLTNNTLAALTSYDHPVLGYSLQYPINWDGGTQAIPGSDLPYQDFEIFSPAFKMSDSNPPSILIGALILIRVDKTNQKTATEWFSLQSSVSKEIKYKKLKYNGKQMLQYDNNEDGIDTTNTVLVDSGNAYLIKYRYANSGQKDLYWDSYIALLESFKLP